MEIDVFRINSGSDHTNSIILIDGKYQCDGLEDQYQKVKIPKETRVDDGRYPIRFRDVGGFHNRYKRRFRGLGREWHKGMLEFYNVPNFKWTLIHILNHDDQTDGCLGVGYAPRNNRNWISNSRDAYIKIYPIIRDALLRNEEVFINFKTLDNIDI